MHAVPGPRAGLNEVSRKWGSFLRMPIVPRSERIARSPRPAGSLAGGDTGREGGGCSFVTPPDCFRFKYHPGTGRASTACPPVYISWFQRKSRDESRLSEKGGECGLPIGPGAAPSESCLRCPFRGSPGGNSFRRPDSLRQRILGLRQRRFWLPHPSFRGGLPRDDDFRSSSEFVVRRRYEQLREIRDEPSDGFHEPHNS